MPIQVSNREKIELLKSVSLFSKLHDNELEIVSQNSNYYTFNKGDVIFKEGSFSESLYMIKDGEVLIKKKQDDNSEIDIAKFIPGECFGELDLLENAPMNATAVAEVDTTLLIFPEKGVHFKDVLQKYPKTSARILYKLLAMIASRIRNTNRLISNKSQWIQDLRRQLLRDKLTGLYNRTFLEEDFANLLLENGEQISLIMIKPDNFKEINDNYGHDAGDNALKLIADTLKSFIRKRDMAARYRGDEFSVILPGLDTETALRFAKYFKSSLKKINFNRITKGNGFTISFSFGVVTYPLHAKDNKSLVNKAFEKMNKAREFGGNCICCGKF